MSKASYWLDKDPNLTQSYTFTSHEELTEHWNSWQAEARQRYSTNPNHKRKIKSNAVLIEEGLIIIGTDVVVTNENIESIAKDFIKRFEEDNRTQVRHWSYHNHEGHKNENGEEKINRHVHFLFDNVNNDGEMVRRNWARSYLEKLQEDIYEVSKAYLPNIGKVIKSTHDTVEIEGRKVKINTRKNIGHKEYRIQRELETAIEIKNQELYQANMIIKNLNAEVARYKADAEEASNQLENIKKDQHLFKQGLKWLGLDEEMKVQAFFQLVKERFSDLKNKITSLANRIQELESKNDDLEKGLKMKDITIQSLVKEIEANKSEHKQEVDDILNKESSKKVQIDRGEDDDEFNLGSPYFPKV
jgi:hypothetical protein